MGVARDDYSHNIHYLIRLTSPRLTCRITQDMRHAKRETRDNSHKNHHKYITNDKRYNNKQPLTLYIEKKQLHLTMRSMDQPEIEVTYSSDIDVEVDEAGNISISPHHGDGDLPNNNKNPHTKRQMIGASVAGALAGCFACGPIFGIPLGAGTAALAVSSPTPAGAWTRKGGDAVATAGIVAGERIQKLDEERHLVDKTKKTAVEGYQWTSKRLKNLDDEHHLVDKTKEGARKGYQWASKRLDPNDAPRAAVE
jgi:hypothetical protein